MSQRTILIADDDHANLTFLEEMLASAGYRVITASSADEAIQIGVNTQPDLAIIELHMPNSVGIDTARVLREQAGVDSLFLTSEPNRHSVELAVKDGALGYLIKPLQESQLLPALESALECSLELKRLQSNENKLSDAIQRNREISVAIGIYMERFQTTEQAAFEALRSFARSERRKLVEIAHELIKVTDRRNELIHRINQNHMKNQHR